MKILSMELGEKNYDIIIESGLLLSIGSYIESFTASGIAVITDSKVWELFGTTFTEAMSASSLVFSPIILQPGEQSKTISVLEEIYESLGRARIKRDGLIIAFGGGVVGDIAGFAAATWNRGTNYVQIPTTLLAQVDSSIGGKTAVNVTAGKNLVGAFHQPKLVLIDTALLSQLPAREFSCGMAEVIKYASIRSVSMFERLEQLTQPASILPAGLTVRELLGEDPLSEIIFECCSIKKEIVSMDEFDKGERMLLNFGHTFGHAIEKRGNYSKYNHGEAVAMGMVIAAGIGECIGETKKNSAERLKSLLKSCGLIAESPYHPKELLSDIESDKKSDYSGIWLALIRDLGDAFLKHCNFQQLRNYTK
jgi:3-dehydroquinate synthase